MKKHYRAKVCSKVIRLEQPTIGTVLETNQSTMLLELDDIHTQVEVDKKDWKPVRNPQHKFGKPAQVVCFNRF